MSDVLTFDENEVQKLLEENGYECSKLEKGFIAKQKGCWPLYVVVEPKFDEVHCYTYFTSKPNNDRAAFLEAINNYNRRTTLTTFKLDDDGNSFVVRALPCRGGLFKKQLLQLIKEGDIEINTFAPEFLTNFVE
ncbi:MAG: YbjN domain-containing protein [Brevinematia bacterium]